MRQHGKPPSANVGDTAGKLSVQLHWTSHPSAMRTPRASGGRGFRDARELGRVLSRVAGRDPPTLPRDPGRPRPELAREGPRQPTRAGLV